METMKIEEALKKLREGEKRKFIQTVDLIINLQNFDVRKESLNSFFQVPNPSEKKICAFLSKKSDVVDTLTEADFMRFKTPREMKHLAKKYDFFIAVAPLMGKIATTFGRVFGPLGKMPNPQAGIMPVDNDESIKAMVEKMKKLIRVKTKDRSIKIPIGKEDMPDGKLIHNIESLIMSIENALPRKKENIKNVLVKFTMTSPIKILESKRE